MSGDSLLLGLDLGTTRSKAVLMDGEGRERGSSAVPTPFTTHGARVEMPVPVLQEAVADVVAGLGAPLERVVAVGIAGMAESGAPYDGEGQPIAPVMAWHDPRGEETVARLEDRFGEELPARMGQRLRTVSSAAKLGWLVDQGGPPPARWLGVPETCLWLLTGAQATEHSLAARTGCYDVAERRYMPEVAEAIGLPVDVFAEVAGAGEAMGRVTSSGSAWSGLPRGIPVTVAGHDHLAGAVGVGAEAQDLVNSVGTAETVVRRHDQVPDVRRALELGVAVSVFPAGGWVVLASAARAGVVLDRAAHALGLSIGDLDGMVDEEAGFDASGLVRGLQAGEDQELPDAPPGRVWASLLAALVERTFEAVEKVTELLGPAERLVVFGGGSDSGPWMRLKAERSEVPVLRATAKEAVARGAAVFAGVAAGWWPAVGEAPPAPLERVPGAVSSA